MESEPVTIEIPENGYQVKELSYADSVTWSRENLMRLRAWLDDHGLKDVIGLDIRDDVVYALCYQRDDEGNLFLLGGKPAETAVKTALRRPLIIATKDGQ